MIPHVFVELGLLYIIIEPIIIIIPNIAKTPRIKPRPAVKMAIIAPATASHIPPRRTKIPPIIDNTNAAVGFSSIFMPDNLVV